MKRRNKNWWLLLVKGIIFIALAFIAFMQPAGALLGIAVYIAITALLNGIIEISSAIVSRKTDDNFGWHLTIGILDTVFGFILFTNPGLTAEVLPFLVGFWAVFYGIMLFVNSFTIKKSGIKNWWIDLLSGVLTIIIGYLIMINPIIGALTITFWLGFGLLILGVATISIAFRLRPLVHS